MYRTCRVQTIGAEWKVHFTDESWRAAVTLKAGQLVEVSGERGCKDGSPGRLTAESISLVE